MAPKKEILADTTKLLEFMDSEYYSIHKILKSPKCSSKIGTPTSVLQVRKLCADVGIVLCAYADKVIRLECGHPNHLAKEGSPVSVSLASHVSVVKSFFSSESEVLAPASLEMLKHQISSAVIEFYSFLVSSNIIKNVGEFSNKKSSFIQEDPLANNNDLGKSTYTSVAKAEGAELLASRIGKVLTLKLVGSNTFFDKHLGFLKTNGLTLVAPTTAKLVVKTTSKILAARTIGAAVFGLATRIKFTHVELDFNHILGGSDD